MVISFLGLEPLGQAQAGVAPCGRRKEAQEDRGGSHGSTDRPGQAVPKPGGCQGDSQVPLGQARGAWLRGPDISREEELEGP